MIAYFHQGYRFTSALVYLMVPLGSTCTIAVR
jgi:hypothetical protein